ncbi:MAG: hypothetical protein HZC41_15495 [Chloroflexi bacterium]|nr:hypothetical protein [Chloroflexota bacterium]
MAVEQELQSALADQDRFEALALLDLNRDRLLFLGTAEGADPELKPALEAFLLRLVTDTDNHDQFKQTEEVVFYDIAGRQLVCHYFEQGGRRGILVAVVAPQKTYKQIVKRLVKTLKPLL